MRHIQIIDSYLTINKECLEIKERFPALYKEVLKHDKVALSRYTLSEKAYSEYIEYWRERNDFYCASRRVCPHPENSFECLDCLDRLHKWPTLKQFKKEFNEDYPDDAPVWKRAKLPPVAGICPVWKLYRYGQAKQEQRVFSLYFIVCACSKYGKPFDEWVPDED
jgi:hypothetical protein